MAKIQVKNAKGGTKPSGQPKQLKVNKIQSEYSRAKSAGSSAHINTR
jgi:hypothetical protein